MKYSFIFNLFNITTFHLASTRYLGFRTVAIEGRLGKTASSMALIIILALAQFVHLLWLDCCATMGSSYGIIVTSGFKIKYN